MSIATVSGQWEAGNPFLNMDATHLIMEFLPLDDLRSCSLVSKDFYKISEFVKLRDLRTFSYQLFQMTMNQEENTPIHPIPRKLYWSIESLLDDRDPLLSSAEKRETAIYLDLVTLNRWDYACLRENFERNHKIISVVERCRIVLQSQKSKAPSELLEGIHLARPENALLSTGRYYLPWEVVRTILEFLPVKDQQSCSLLSSSFYANVQEAKLRDERNLSDQLRKIIKQMPKEKNEDTRELLKKCCSRIDLGLGGGKGSAPQRWAAIYQGLIILDQRSYRCLRETFGSDHKILRVLRLLRVFSRPVSLRFEAVFPQPI